MHAEHIHLLASLSHVVLERISFQQVILKSDQENILHKIIQCYPEFGLKSTADLLFIELYNISKILPCTYEVFTDIIRELIFEFCHYLLVNKENDVLIKCLRRNSDVLLRLADDKKRNLLFAASVHDNITITNELLLIFHFSYYKIKYKYKYI